MTGPGSQPDNGEELDENASDGNYVDVRVPGEKKLSALKTCRKLRENFHGRLVMP